MKKIIFTLLAATMLVSCGSNNSSESEKLIPKDVNYLLLTDEGEIKRITDAVIAKAGDNISKLEEIDISVRRPSIDGFIKKEGAPDDGYIILSHLNPKDPNKLLEYRYSSDDEQWRAESKSVQLMMGDKENFKLEDHMYDASALTSDMISKIVMEAWNKYKDETKYSDQWVYNIKIKDAEVQVRVRGVLASNEQIKTELFVKKLN